MKRVLSVIAAILAVALTGVLSARFAIQPALESDAFLEEGPHGPWLIADNSARILTPDRPFDFRELDGHRDGSAPIGRWREFTVTTNALGFRGPELGAKTGTRVLALGESVSMGWGVTEEQAWPALVAKQLDIDVLNVGIPDAEPRTLADWCVAVGPSLDVDALVFARRIGGEEPTAEAYAEHLLRCVAALDVPTLVVWAPSSRFDRLAQFNDANDLERLRAMLPFEVLDLTPSFRSAQVGGASLGPDLELLKDGVEVARREHEGLDHFPYGPDFDADPSLREPLFFDIGHPDTEGFVLFADEVAKALEPLLTK